MPEPTIPSAVFGVCGGSGTLSLGTAASAEDERVEVVADGLVFETPFGESPAFTHFRVDGPDGARDALSVRMHGWRRGVKRGDASLQTFWVFDQAGVKKVLSDGGVGSLNHLLDPRDVVVPSDFVDMTTRQDIYVRGDHLLIMREPVCADLHGRLFAGASEHFARVFRRGTYVVTDGPRFETVSEIEAIRRTTAGDVIGQSMAPEVVLARDIGACWAGLYIVVNYAEGVVKPWEHDELKAIFFDESDTIARIVLDVVATAPLDAGCGCADLRKPSLLDLPEAGS
jgi:5'-methylthioadenosine phosphorylase